MDQRDNQESHGEFLRPQLVSSSASPFSVSATKEISSRLDSAEDW